MYQAASKAECQPLTVELAAARVFETISLKIKEKT